MIEVCDVNKYFGEEHVLKHVSHSFEKGKIHGIVSVLILGGVILAAVIGIILVKKRQKNYGGAYL